MSGETLSTNMNLPIPGVGVTSGPDWASDLNSCLTIIDAHTHAPGSGTQITTSGLNINSDLTIGSNNLTQVRSLRFEAQATPLILATDLGCLYESGVDLYYNDGNGNHIQITDSGGVAGTPGSIGSLVSPAAATYVSGTPAFVFQSNSNVAASIDGRSFVLRNSTASSKGLTLSPPNAMAANYTLVLPALPTSTTNFVTVDTSGNMAATLYVDNITMQIGGGLLFVKSGGVGTTQLADAGVTGAKIASATITGSNIASATIAGSNIASATVTGSNIAAATVTRSNMVAVGQVLSTSSGTFSTTSGTYVDVTNLSVTLTTTGRLVFLGLIPDGAAIGASSIGTLANGTVTLNFSGSDISLYETLYGSTAAGGASWPVGGHFVYATSTAGTHTYKVQIKTSGGIQGIVRQAILIAYELA